MNQVIGKKASIMKVKLFLIIVLAFGYVGMLTGCDSSPASEPFPQENTFSAPQQQTLGLVLDTTSSTDPSFASDIRARLIEKVRTHVLDLPEDLTKGVQGNNTIAMLIYLVGNAPLSYASSDHYEITVQGYATLPPMPDNVDSENYGDDVAQWAEYRDGEWMQQYSAAVQSRDAALSQLSSMELSTSQASGIQTTTSALARVLPKGAPILICSDLENNQEVAIDGSLSGSKVFIVRPYTNSDMAYQGQLEADFRAYLSGMGVADFDITTYAPEQARDALNAAFLLAAQIVGSPTSAPSAQQVDAGTQGLSSSTASSSQGFFGAFGIFDGMQSYLLIGIVCVLVVGAVLAVRRTLRARRRPQVQRSSQDKISSSSGYSDYGL